MSVSKQKIMVSSIIFILLIARIFVFHDFRYGIYSIAFIQVIFPLVILIAFMSSYFNWNISIVLAYVLIIFFLILGELGAYAFIYIDNSNIENDQVGDALAMLSFISQFLVATLIFVGICWVKKK